MTWHPKSDEEFKDFLRQKVDGLPHHLREKLQNTLIQVHKVKLPGRDGTEENNLFVFSKYNERVLFYDDVEDEFGTARIALSGTPTNYSLNGLLEHALLSLFAEHG